MRLMKRCSVCGSLRHVDVHHINGDHFDNRRSNRTLLCRSCHRYVHGWSEVPRSSQRLEVGEVYDTMKNVKRLLTPREVGKQLGVTPRTVVRWINEEKIKAVKVGRVWRIPEEEVREIYMDGLA